MRLKELRLSKGVTQKEVADSICCSSKLKGDSSFSISRIRREISKVEPMADSFIASFSSLSMSICHHLQDDGTLLF